jgi:GntR family transcriptional regulator
MPDPIYRSIAEDLRQQIESGDLEPGQQLRTEIELRDDYNASRNTIRDAIKLLVTRGLVETRPGQGTFVVETIVPFLTTLTGEPDSSSGEGDTYMREVGKLRTPTATQPEVGIHQADDHATAELRLSPGTPVISRHQRRFIDGIPWSLQTSFYPMSLVEQGAARLIQAGDIQKGGTVAYLRETLGIKQAGYRDTITVRPPDNVEAAFFKLPDDGRISIIETRRTAFDEQGTPVRLTVSVYPADRNQFALNVGDVPPEIAYPRGHQRAGHPARRARGRRSGAKYLRSA